MAKLGEPTKILTIEFPDKIDVRMDVNIIREDLRKNEKAFNAYERLAEVVRFALSNDSGVTDPKTFILAFINRFKLNESIKDLDIRKHKFVLEADSIVMFNRETKETLINIKVLKTVLTEDILREYHKKIRAGTDTAVIMDKIENTNSDA